mmetsp:Transcript_3389/g.4735  ORF Transcript_3389/g.4735 Transcript_3389/m.4735 type:complete len:259 (+) Transcript_3389:152-928(+)
MKCKVLLIVLGISLVYCIAILIMPFENKNVEDTDAFVLSDGRRLVSQARRIDIRSYAIEFVASVDKFYFTDAIYEWQKTPGFGTWFSQVLANVEFSAFFWECPPVTLATAARTPLECRIIDAGSFAPASIDDFKTYLQEDCEAVAFPNLDRSSMLIVPCPTRHAKSHEIYGHLANFCRQATSKEHDSLWRQVAITFDAYLKQRNHLPVWLSTEGSGVPWLHVRLDPRPKYYKTQQFRQWPPPPFFSSSSSSESKSDIV